MNNSRKYIWSVYLLLWVYFIFFDSSYNQSDHIGYYLLFGWIPFLIADRIWKKNEQTTTQLSTNQPDPLEQYNLLFQIIDKDYVLRILQAGRDSKIFLDDNKIRLQAFGERVGKDPEALEKNTEDFFKLTIEEMTEFDEIRDTINDLRLNSDYVDEFSSILDEINMKLNRGLSLTTAKTLLDAQLKDIADKRQEARIKLIEARVVGEELVKLLTPLRTKNPNATLKEINAVKIDGNIIIKRLKEEVKKEFDKN